MADRQFTTLRLAVDGLHELHIERHGTPGGIPTVVLHGGPGAGISPAGLASIDSARHDILQFDQRGTGRSTSRAELRDNSTPHLIADIEAIRRELGIERWLVIGGSWGSFLSLAYAQAHPERVLGLRLHDIFLAGDEDVDWWFHGIRHIPAIILQGRYDMVTPMASAWRLRRHWPEAGFEIVTLANHASAGVMAKAPRRATDRLADLIEGIAA